MLSESGMTAMVRKAGIASVGSSQRTYVRLRVMSDPTVIKAAAVTG